MLQGFLNVITDPQHPVGIKLRDKFVFKVIPILNPDGVARGYFRLDILGNNLNRYYSDPRQSLQPQIYAAK